MTSIEEKASVADSSTLADAPASDTKSQAVQNDHAAVHEDLGEEETHNYPTGVKLGLIMLSLMLAVLCVALDNTIIAVAIPHITDEFHALNDVGWYASSYLLTTCALQLFFGKLYTLYNVKWVFLAGLFIFEVGSLICGVAPSSTVLIVGRAIAGLGSAGIFTGALVTVAHTVPKERRPVFLSMIGGMYGIASIAGPLMGGAFTDHATWRWCFYINLPLGGITAPVLLFLLKLPPKPPVKRGSFWATTMQLDPLGTFIFIPSIICVLLALQWGDVTYAWSDGRIIALFVVFALSLIAFLGIQIWMKEDATVPVRIATQRSIAAASFFGFFLGGSFFIYIYYIPIWFQVIRGSSAVQSGIYTLPMILANVVGMVGSGIVTTKTGHYAPFFFASCVFMSIGAGLIYTWEVDTPQAAWVGYQFLYGLGVGMGFQQGSIAAQSVLKIHDVPTGTAMVMFIQLLGGALFVAVAQNLFTTTLVSNLTDLHIPGLVPDAIVHTGATHLREMVSSESLPQVLVAYNDALVQTFQIAMILSCITFIGALGVEWRSVKGKEIAPGGA